MYYAQHFCAVTSGVTQRLYLTRPSRATGSESIENQSTLSPLPLLLIDSASILAYCP